MNEYFPGQEVEVPLSRLRLHHENAGVALRSPMNVVKGPTCKRNGFLALRQEQLPVSNSGSSLRRRFGGPNGI